MATKSRRSLRATRPPTYKQRDEKIADRKRDKKQIFRLPPQLAAKR